MKKKLIKCEIVFSVTYLLCILITLFILYGIDSYIDRNYEPYPIRQQIEEESMIF